MIDEVVQDEVPTCPRCGCVLLRPVNVHECARLPEHPDALEARALGQGAPKIEDVLSSVDLDKLAALALAAPIATEIGLVSSRVEPDTTTAVSVFTQMLAQSEKACWMVFRQDADNAPVVVSAFTGNGPNSEAAARLYGAAKDAVLALVLHARAKQREVDTLREALAAFTAAAEASATPGTEDRSSVGGA